MLETLRRIGVLLVCALLMKRFQCSDAAKRLRICDRGSGEAENRFISRRGSIEAPPI